MTSQEDLSAPLSNGAGIKEVFSKAKDFIANFLLGVRKHAPPGFRQTMLTHGSQLVVSIQPTRYPIASYIKFLGNLISRGELDKRRVALNYDDIFHLCFLINLKNGTKLIASKEEVMRLAVVKDFEAYKASHPGIQFFDVIPLREPVPLAIAFNAVEKKMGESLWLYSSDKNNCQEFVLQFCRVNIFSSIDSATRTRLINWVVQDVKSLLGDSQIFKVVSDISTDFSATLDRALHGSGIPLSKLKELQQGSGIGDDLKKFIDDILALFGSSGKKYITNDDLNNPSLSRQHERGDLLSKQLYKLIAH